MKTGKYGIWLLKETIGIDFLSKNIHHNGHLYRLLLWDTAGQEKFRSLIPAYLRDAHCAVFVYDVTAKKSYNDLEEWIKMFDNYKRQDSIMLIVGNKTDLK